MKEADGHISFVILGVYVDDIIPVSNVPPMLKAEKAALCERFEMINQGEIHYLLGLSIKRDRESRTLTFNKSTQLHRESAKEVWNGKLQTCLYSSLEPEKKFQQLSSIK